MKVFISHSSADKKFVQRLATDLRIREGIDAWFDQWEINPGDRIPERLEEGLSEAEVLTLVLSPDSVNSEWVEYERQAWLAIQIEEEKRAKEESRPSARRLIPVLYQDCQKPVFLQPIHHVKITDQEYESGFKQLVNAIMRVSEKPPLKKSKDYQALYKRLKSSGEEGKDYARRLLEESNDPDVLRTCLGLLGEDVKEDVKRLLKTQVSKDPEIIRTCLHLLGEGAKEDAERLIADSTTPPEILCSCLDLLEWDKVKELTVRLLMERNTTPIAPVPGVSPRQHAFTLLKLLMPTQFAEVIFIYNMPKAHLPTNVAHVQQAITLIEYAEQREGEVVSELLNTIYEVAPHFRR